MVTKRFELFYAFCRSSFLFDSLDFVQEWTISVATTFGSTYIRLLDPS